MTMFVELYKKGYIYRDNRLINWCPTCGSTISDLEVKYQPETATLYEVRYAIAGSDESLTVATVRPETILADTAIAVNPADDRATATWWGRPPSCRSSTARCPIIADDYVKMDFGTGALKVTPGHDTNDFEIGRRHDLAELSAIGFDGRMTELDGEPSPGSTVAEAGQQRATSSPPSGLLGLASTTYEHEVGHCDRYRRHGRAADLAAVVHAHGRAGRARQRRRALGHGALPSRDARRTPISTGWTTCGRGASRASSGGGTGSRSGTAPTDTPRWPPAPPAACAECGAPSSSATPTSSTPGSRPRSGRSRRSAGPSDDPRLEQFYPGRRALDGPRHHQPLGRAHDHDRGSSSWAMSRSRRAHPPHHPGPDGRRMSKSLGTGIDPLELVEEYGADATRFGLMKMSSTQDVRFDEGAIQRGRGSSPTSSGTRRGSPSARPTAGASPAAWPGRPRSRTGGSPRVRPGADDVLRQHRPASTSRPRSRRCTPSSGTTSATGTSRLLKPRLYGEDRWRGTGAGGAPVGARPHPAHGPPDHAVCDRGDLGRSCPASSGLLMLAATPSRPRAATPPRRDGRRDRSRRRRSLRAGHAADAAHGFDR